MESREQRGHFNCCRGIIEFGSQQYNMGNGRINQQPHYQYLQSHQAALMFDKLRQVFCTSQETHAPQFYLSTGIIIYFKNQAQLQDKKNVINFTVTFYSIINEPQSTFAFDSKSEIIYFPFDNSNFSINKLTWRQNLKKMVEIFKSSLEVEKCCIKVVIEEPASTQAIKQSIYQDMITCMDSLTSLLKKEQGNRVNVVTEWPGLSQPRMAEIIERVKKSRAKKTLQINEICKLKETGMQQQQKQLKQTRPNKQKQEY